MKNLLFESILLVSHREKKAKKVQFDSGINVVKGENDTGKSSLIKSLFYALGASPCHIHHRWKDADVAVLLRFSIDKTSYAIYRHRNSFSLFNSSDKLIGTYSKVTSELAPILAKLLDFNLKMLDRNGVSITPPPAYLFLAFYIDQDQGWLKPWDSFQSLQQVPRWKSTVINYHVGIRPDKWYKLDTERRILESDQIEPTRQKDALQNLIKKTRSELSRTDFEIDITQFKKEIKLLIGECDQLKKQEQKYRMNLNLFRIEKIRLEAQIEITIKTHDELSADYKYALEKLDDMVDCPTCGVQHENSFAERFDIARDTETCNDLLKSLRDDLARNTSSIEEVEKQLSLSADGQKRINTLLASKHGKIRLKDLIKLEGKKSLLEHLRSEIDKLEYQLSKLDAAIKDKKEAMDKIDDKGRSKSIMAKYAENLRKNLYDLDVVSLDEKNFKRLDATIDESGSDLPRAILAYNFAIHHAIESNGNATFCPIVIDAPNQQEQDTKNFNKILNFIANNIPKNHQLILGLVDDYGIDFGGNIIELKHKQYLLESLNYMQLATEIRYFESLNIKGQ